MILELHHIHKTYEQGKMDVPVLKNISLFVEKGEYIAIMGPSGSGKTTLMNIIGCLDAPSRGTYLLNGENVMTNNDNKLSELRLRSIGFVFQNFHLLSRQTALENVALPLLYAGVSKKERLRIAATALERVGLADRMDFKHTQLSGGQCQRVAIARAMVNNPQILLADEPTGALDSTSGKQIMELFQSLNREGVTVIMITHEREIAEYAETIYTILDGRFIDKDGNFVAPEDENHPAGTAPVQESEFSASHINTAAHTPRQKPKTAGATVRKEENAANHGLKQTRLQSFAAPATKTDLNTPSTHAEILSAKKSTEPPLSTLDVTQQEQKKDSPQTRFSKRGLSAKEGVNSKKEQRLGKHFKPHANEAFGGSSPQLEKDKGGVH